MYTEEDLIRHIKKLDIRENNLLTAHVSFKSIGKVYTEEGKTGAEVLIEALRKSVCEGLLMIPSHTYTTLWETGFFDVNNTEPCIGAVPCVAANMAKQAYKSGDKTVIRSLHPSHSVVAFGKKAYEYVADDAHVSTAMPVDGSYGKLKTLKGKILLIGVGLIRNTFIHMIDEYMTQNTPFSKKKVTVRDYEGKDHERFMTPTRGNSDYYEKYRPCLEETGAISYGKIGDSDVIVCDAAKCYDAIKDVWPELN